MHLVICEWIGISGKFNYLVRPWQLCLRGMSCGLASANVEHRAKKKEKTTNHHQWQVLMLISKYLNATIQPEKLLNKIGTLLPL